MSSRTPSIIRNMPNMIPMRAGIIITRMPKIMHRIASTGFETVIPIFFNPFSTTSVNYLSLSQTTNIINRIN